MPLPRRHLCTALLAAAMACDSALPAHARECGDLIMAHNFDQYQGEYRPWTDFEAAEDFALGGQYRTGPDGDMLQTGLDYYYGIENARVGHGQLKLTFKKGAHLCVCLALPAKPYMCVRVRLRRRSPARTSRRPARLRACVHAKTRACTPQEQASEL